MSPSTEPARPQFLVIGNSHTTAIAAALARSPDSRFQVVNIASYFDPVNRRNKFVPADITSLFQPQRIFCTFGGSEHSVMGLLEAPDRFDFRLPSDDSVEPGRVLIPHGLVRSTLTQAMQTGLKNLREIRRLYACPITHLCTPPPFRAIGERQLLPRVFQENLRLGLSPASIRRKLYVLHSDITLEVCASERVGFMKVPAQCRDTEGYLLERYWSKDPTHGNAEYGALMVQLMLEASHG